VDGSNGRRGPIAPAPTREEAAAVIAGLERFMRATAPRRAAPGAGGPDGWSRAAILEGVERAAREELRDPWTNG
jgi:hypothetical protein